MTIDIEKKLLSKLVNISELFRCWDTGLRAEAFSDPTYRQAYDFATRYWRENQMELAPTKEMLIYEFPSILIDDVVEESVSWLSETIQRKYASNQTQELLISAAESVHENPIGTLSDLWRESYKASQVVAPRFDRVNMSENIDERRIRYQQRLDNYGLGPPYGLAEIDTHTHGLLPGELAVVSAYSKVGKSFFLAHTAAQLRRAGYTPILFSLEQSREEMEERVDAYFSGVSYDRLIHSQLSFEEVGVLRRAQDELRELGDLHIQRPPEGDRTVTEMVGRARQLGADYILVDQLSWMDSEKKYTGDRATTMKHGDVIRELREEISNDVVGKIPCLLAVQQGRTSMEGQQRRPEMWKVAESANIERTADIIFGLSRTPQMRVNNATRLDIMGARRCDIKSWLLNWRLRDRSEINVIEEIVE